MSYDAILLAAGQGKRLAATQAKQYIKLLNYTILEHSLNTLASLPEVKNIIVVLAEDDKLFRTLNITDNSVKTIVGGSERAYSVFNALQALNKIGVSSDWVLVHDAARCCVRVDKILQLITTCHAKKMGGILANPVKDTIKQVSNMVVDKTIPRQNLYAAQTPQYFLRQKLMVAYKHAFDKNILPTDEANAMELNQQRCLIVEGDCDNIKVTHPIDLVIAEQILAGQHNV